MKQRFSSLDLQVIAHELSTTLTPSHRLTNVYDITTRIFLLKFSKPSSKHLLLIDSGFRCHLTTFARGTSPKQSPFVAKLRKCLRTRRCTAVRQVASDRVLEFVFSEGAYRLYLEFYAGGNVVLVDREGVIVTLLREVKGGEGGAGECRVGAKYEVSTRAAEGALRERIVAALEASLETEDPAAAAAAATSLPSQGAGKKYKKKAKRKGGNETVKKVLAARMPEFAPALIEHCFRTTGVDVDIKAEDALADEETLDHVVRALEAAEGMIRDIMADVNGTGIKGYIIAKAPRAPAENTGGYKKDKAADKKKKKKGVSFGGDGDEPESQRQQQQQSAFGTTEAVESEQPEKVQEEGEAKGMVYDDFFPFLPVQYVNAPGIKTVACHGYNTTVDSFFSSIESQKSDSRITNMRENAVRRLDAARTDHRRRVEGLQTLQEINTAKAQAIEANLDRVEEVIASVNGLVAKGMDWVAMGQLIDVERKRGNLVAELIKLPLKLAENTVTVTLPEVNYDDEEEEEESDDSADETDEEGEDDASAAPTKPKKAVKTLDIDIDLSLTGYANASSYFTQKKVLLVKESKTIQSSTKALKSTEKKIQTGLQKALKHEKDVLRPVRAQHWFEKFLFFISSDGLMVLAGRDLQQNEILYRRYFRRGDIYVSADIEGAAMVIVKNNPNTPGAPIPPSTLTQAGTLAVATSRAWDAKSGMSAWWVTHEQVGKMVRGEYLETGRFEIKGAKNFLPPAQLILGFGVMWFVDEESRRRHGKHRLGEMEKEQEDAAAAAESEPAGEKADEDGDGRVNVDDDDEDDEDEDAAGAEVEESSDEEFPDAQIESAGEEEEEEAQEEAEPDADADGDGDGEPKAQEQDSGPDEDDRTTATTDRADTPSGSKHMSAKDRRELRKARLGGGGGGTTANDITAKPASPKPAPPKPAQAQVRGKKGKAKKLATKYAHQDAEDRALAMSLLGSAAAAKTDDAAAKKAAKDEEAAFQKARRREQHARAAREAMMAEETRMRDGDEDDETVSVPLDAFVGTPLAGDVLLDAVPVCAPWGAMGRFKYRVKMQPGAVKKGKAVKDILGKWLAEGEKKKSVDGGEGMWPAEMELIKGWREAEIINCVGVSKVRIFSAGSDAAADKKRGGGGGGGGGRRGGKGGKRK
ncbi:hypothetical protein DFP73DRAFT_508159 [Morchella snyderi]|nr:hypothetical protein DFP73DRAFT_508159 [Morchella snyderi]